MNAAAIQHLARADKVLGRLIRRVGPCTLKPNNRRTPFEALVQSVAHQQLNGTADAALNLSGALKRQGLTIDILLMRREGEFLAEAEQNFRVIDLGCKRTYELPGKLLRYRPGVQPSV